MPAAADPLRIATYNASLSRKGPGLLLRDILDRHPQVMRVVGIIQHVRPDILLINEFDWDYEGRALSAFVDLLAEGEAGLTYSHSFAPSQNTGVPSGHDLDNDGKLGGAGDAFGFGQFRGQYAMALLSRFPLQTEPRDFSQILWRDIPGAILPRHPDGTPFPTAEAQTVMRLSSKGHWDVPIDLPDGRVLHVLASHPTPPVFDGPENRNGLRNRDEVLFWHRYLTGALADLTGPPPDGTFVIAGDLNADPHDGDGDHDAINTLLQASYLQDPQPTSEGARAAGTDGVNRGHTGDPAQDTADWRDDAEPGNLRADYVLPSRDLVVRGSGVFWPAAGEAGHDLLGSGKKRASDHHLVWVDFE